ncbi:MAG: hypothetical protein IKE91_07170 [Clostridia bacterium]|nr:hypothetical protein [Clostridia bacterium]
MDTKTTSWVAYLTFIGLIIAFCTGDKEGAKFHLNQALVITIFAVAGGIVIGIFTAVLPILGMLLSVVYNLFIFICWLLGLIAAINQEEKEVPLLGQIKILK